MSPFQVYKIYLAAKLHFTTSYDVFKYNGAVNAGSEEEFLQKPFRHLFSKLSNRLKTPQEAAQYFVSCFAYDADVFTTYDADQAYTQWKKHREMMTQLILDDIETLHVPQCLEGNPCELQSLISGNKIQIETAVALNRVFKFSQDWKNNFVYSRLGVKIEKLDRFVKYNECKVNEFIKHHEQSQTASI